MKTSHHARIETADGGQLRVQQRVLTEFLSLLFGPDELIELRVVETWRDSLSKKHSRLLHRTWQSSVELVASFPELLVRNEIGNIFFGVNPRRDRGGTKASVDQCRVVWVDLDNTTLEDATGRWSDISIPPTIVVDSGHGIHAYWKLAETISLIDPAQRIAWEAIVKSFASTLRGDATHDCTRLLRLPGTMNVKERRNGVAPVACRLVSIDPEYVYPRAVFERFLSNKSSETSPGNSRYDAEIAGTETKLSGATIGRSRDHRRIQGVLRYLDRDVPDRSVRDMAAVILLIECGLSKRDIQSMVARKSKFAEGGDDYFERTFNAAENTLRR